MSLVSDASFVNPTEADEYGGLVENWKNQGYSLVYFAISGSYPASDSPSFTTIALFAIADPARPEAKKIISSLKQSGKEVFMLSGDNEVTARTVGRELGINAEHVVAGVLPHEKANFIQELRQRKSTQSTPRLWKRQVERNAVVMFAGDGLNDSAAVASADVGVAFSHGSQVTLTSASFVILQTKAPLEGVLRITDLSRKVYRRQKVCIESPERYAVLYLIQPQFNFGWAMVYNIVLLPLAAGAFYPLNHTRIPPVWSALAMALSSVSVVLSSLALRWGI
ncbi:hypothetical protein FS842_007846 [Serendipita sp. 407]|nr:hypothetical protein FS842_007846 [Serendipita sp. 407]